MPFLIQQVLLLCQGNRACLLLLAAISVTACTQTSSSPPLRSTSHGPHLNHEERQLDIGKAEQEIVYELAQLGATKIEMSTLQAPAHLNIKIDPEVYNINWFIPHYRVVLETRFNHGILVAMKCWDADKLERRYHHLQPYEQISQIVFLDDGSSWNTVVSDAEHLNHAVKMFKDK
ncbi:MAG: hypothetical protein AAGB26_16525 [Planctomycetota bacterium]